jgi:hypothetical protein
MALDGLALPTLLGLADEVSNNLHFTADQSLRADRKDIPHDQHPGRMSTCRRHLERQEASWPEWSDRGLKSSR